VIKRPCKKDERSIMTVNESLNEIELAKKVKAFVLRHLEGKI